MNETRYLISEAAKITQVEAHVLRYWEEELGLNIGRNKMGHRYYTEKDIRTFENIKELKKKGLQLRAIKDMLAQMEQADQTGAPREALPRVIVVQPQKFTETESGQAAKNRPAAKRGPERKASGNKPKVSEKAKAAEKTKEERFQEIMERLIKDIERSEKKEGRYRRLDEAIRKHQQSRKMVAATEENTKQKGRGKKVREKKKKK